MSQDIGPEAMQSRIQQARREAETLKDKIKRKKDELADTTREWQETSFSGSAVLTRYRSESHRSSATRGYSKRTFTEVEEDAERTFGKDLRNALVDGQKAPCFSFARRQAHHLGRIYHEQSSRHPT